MVQFARFSTLCRTYAPMYRQLTLAALPRAIAGDSMVAPGAMAYGDVLSAWRYYLRHLNQGRPFGLLGHSQGTIHLIKLLAEEIEGSEAAGRMLSAMLIGYNVEVPEGRLVGGSFRRTPLCTRAGQTGCVITYVSFRSASPPPPGALFGRAPRPGMTVACTNPANLAGGNAPLDSYWFARPASSAAPTSPGRRRASRRALPAHRRTVSPAASTAAARLSGVDGECRPADARTTRYRATSISGRMQPIGLQLGDVTSPGDLLRLVAAQRDAWRRRRPR